VGYGSLQNKEEGRTVEGRRKEGREWWRNFTQTSEIMRGGEGMKEEKWVLI